MRTDYKIKWLTSYDSGQVEVVVNVYEGDVTTELEEDRASMMRPVTRYRRTRLLRTFTLSLTDLPLSATDAQIRRGLNALLAEDTTRTPIEEQRNGP